MQKEVEDPMSEEQREQKEMQPVLPEEEETASLATDADGIQELGDAVEGQSTGNNSNFGETMNVLKMNLSEITLLRTSFDLLLQAMGNDREAVGDAIYGTKIGALSAIKDSFTTPRAVVSLRFFNCFRLLLEKAEDPDELKIYVETLAFKHLQSEITEQRVERVMDAFLELLVQNVPSLPPGSNAAWKQMLGYCGSCYRFVGDSYGERLRVIKEDWAVVQQASSKKEEKESEDGEKAEGDKAEGDEAKEEEDTRDAGAETFSFGRMCAFSNEVMGQKTEGWMLELLEVFHVLVDMISSPVHLQEVRAFKPYNGRLFSSLTEEQLDRFRTNVFTEFFAKSQASQDLFKQSQSRLRYIADRVLQSSYDMFHKNKTETLDDLSALGLRHIGYGIPIELFGPFVEVCVLVMHPLVQEFPNEIESTKLIWCPKDKAHQISEKEVPEHMMIEGFRWSIGLTARVLVRTIMDGSTAVMQAIHFDDSKRLRRALLDAPRAERCVWQLAVQVGSQSISPLFWALRSGAHDTAKTMIQDMLTIRADRDHYYFGVDELFKYQPNIADNILREAPFLAETLLDGLIWRSHKSKDNLRPVIYYLKHMLSDMDEEKMLSRALISYVRFNHPQTIMHPILTSLDLLWDRLAKRFFLMDRMLTMFNCVVFILAECLLNQPQWMYDSVGNRVLAVARILVYSLGFCRLLYWHLVQFCKACKDGALIRIYGIKFPEYLTRSSDLLSFVLMSDLLGMMTVRLARGDGNFEVEPMFHCMGSTQEDEDKVGLIAFRCADWTDEMSLLYEIFVILGVFLYVILIVEVGSISVKLSEYRVLCLHAIEQVLLCFGVVFLCILTFSFAISGMTREVKLVSNKEWDDVGASLSTLLRLSFGALDLEGIQTVSQESPLLIVVIVLFMMLVYSFFFNLLVSQFCGVYTSLAADIKGHARLARGEIIIETFKAVKLTRWHRFMESLQLDQRVDFEEGDIGLAGGIKDFEPALAHPVAKDQIIRFGGKTDSHLPWPEKHHENEDNMERIIQRTIQKSLQKFLGKGKVGGSAFTSDTDGNSSSHHSSGKNNMDD